MDYYSILGVSKNATEQEIRKAYKKQSMQHHPDRGGNEEQFKKINEAYSTLKDPQKRAAYDNPQPQYNFNTSNMGGFEDIFAHAFGQGFDRRNPRQNRNIRIAVNLNLEDVLTGKDIVAKYRLHSGKIEEASINIPQGVESGQSIRYTGLGDDSIPGLQRGDLIININVAKHREWIRDGCDLHKTIDINVFDAIIGSKVKILTLNEKLLELKIPQGTQPGQTFNIAHHGLPRLRDRYRGNIYVHINVKIPKKLTQEQLEKIQDLKNEIITCSK